MDPEVALRMPLDMVEAFNRQKDRERREIERQMRR